MDQLSTGSLYGITIVQEDLNLASLRILRSRRPRRSADVLLAMHGHLQHPSAEEAKCLSVF
jgi:hypothetical protein